MAVCLLKAGDLKTESKFGIRDWTPDSLCQDVLNFFQRSNSTTVREVDRFVHGGDHRHVCQGLHAGTSLCRASPLCPESCGDRSRSQRGFCSGKFQLKQTRL